MFWLGQTLGVTDISPEVVVVLSHATQECLRVLIQKMTVMAEHRKATLKVGKIEHCYGHIQQNKCVCLCH